jgi:SAM-dependent methyltransferase
MDDWISFWDAPNAIFVNDRHLRVHCARMADDVIPLIPSPDARVLDHGCGEALCADRVAAACAQLMLCDAAPSVRARVKARFPGEAKIRVLAPEDVERLPDHSLDLIVAMSLCQYLSTAIFGGLLVLWHRLLAPQGRLIVADVIPPDLGVAADALALLRLAAREGFLGSAVIALAQTLFSPYRKLRAEPGLTTYTPEDMEAQLAAAGFRSERLPRNLGHNQRRLAFCGQKVPSSPARPGAFWAEAAAP